MSANNAVRLQKPENLEFESLRGFEKAAILVNYLGPTAAKVLLKRMDDGDIRKLLTVMNKYRIVPIAITKKVLEEYYELVSESEDYIFSDQTTAKETVVDALGEERARGVLGHLSTSSTARPQLESLESVDAKSLANFLVNEHPQTVSVILAHLEPEKKGEVLKRLPEAFQAEVVLRMANLEHVAPELIAEVDRVLKEELSSVGTTEAAALGGVQPVAEMLNVMDKNTEKAIMARIEEKDPILAEEIRKLMFVFEDIIKIDDKGIQALLKKFPTTNSCLHSKLRTKRYETKSSRISLSVLHKCSRTIFRISARPAYRMSNLHRWRSSTWLVDSRPKARS